MVERYKVYAKIIYTSSLENNKNHKTVKSVIHIYLESIENLSKKR